MKKQTKFSANIKEFFRKQLVKIKRRPSIIPLFFLAVCLIVNTFSMTGVSNTTSLINGKNMGLTAFAFTLFSILAVVSFLNVYPKHGKKVNKVMLVVTYVFIAVILLCDFNYGRLVNYALTRPEAPIVVTPDRSYITQTQTMLIVHEILLIVSTALIALLPVYRKLLLKIDTSVTSTANNDDKVEIVGNIDIVE